MKLVAHIARPKYLLVFFCIGFFWPSFLLSAQQKKQNGKDYGFQISERNIPKKGPDGYESILTVDLDQPLQADKAYEIGFWIFGRQLQDQGYAYPIAVFPSNFRGNVDRDIFDIVESVDILPKLEVLPPPSYTSKGHFTFIVRPKKEYTQLTVALKNSDWGKSPINFRKDVTVTGIFVRPLPGRNKKRELNTTKKEITLNQAGPALKILAYRKLMDSGKSYKISEQSVRIGLYDHRNIDKDVVTIYLNDKIIVDHLQLKSKKRFFNILLRPGKNTITLHAENLGEVAPNTAAILIKSRTKEFMAVLESDLGQSQFFTLVCDEK